MSCERFSQALIDHACGAPIDAATAAHLHACAACRLTSGEIGRRLSAAEANLRHALTLNASPQFVGRVVVRARADEASRWRRRGWWLPAAAAAVVAFAVYLTIPGREAGRDHTRGPGARESIHLAPEAGPAGRTIITTAASPATSVAAKSGPRARAAAARPRRSLGAPDVIVAPDQARAIARLRELLRNGMLDRTIVPEASSAPSEVLISPLSIPELSVPDIQGIAAQPGGADGRR